MLALFSTSLSIFRKSPWLFVAVGAAVVISLCAVCGGIGLLIAPWFVCELFALQLEAHGREVRPRGPSWVLACIVVLGMVVVVASAGWLAALGFGPDMTSADYASAPLPWPEALRRVALIAGAMALAVTFTAPFLHAPLVLLDRGGRLGGALLESAGLMRQAGTLRHLSLSFLAQFFCLSPALLSAIVVARTMERAATPLGILVALPFLTLTIPIGLGMVTSAYLGSEATLGDARRARRQPSLSVLHRLVLVNVLVAPLVGLSLVGASALLPSGPLHSPAPEGVEVASLLPRIPGGALEMPAALLIPETSLEVVVQPGALSLAAGLEEPLIVPWRGSIDALRVVRLRSSYAVEFQEGAQIFHLEITEPGVRVDDSVRRRLEDHLPSSLLMIFLVGFGVVSFAAPAAFAPLGLDRARAARNATTIDPAVRRESLRVALLLTPFAVVTAAAGAIAFFSGP